MLYLNLQVRVLYSRWCMQCWGARGIGCGDVGGGFAAVIVEAGEGGQAGRSGKKLWKFLSKFLQYRLEPKRRDHYLVDSMSPWHVSFLGSQHVLHMIIAFRHILCSIERSYHMYRHQIMTENVTLFHSPTYWDGELHGSGPNSGSLNKWS